MNAELTEVIKQSDQTFFNVLSSIHYGTADENTELLKARFIDQSDKNYPYDALYMYAKNAPTILKYQIVLNNLPGGIYSTEANNKIPDDCGYPSSVIQAPLNQKQTNTGGLAKFLQLKICAEV